jgi:hypothetical protein
MRRFIKHYYEEMLITLAFVFLIALSLLVIWNVSGLLYYLNGALERGTSGEAGVQFHLKEAGELNLLLTP